MCKISAAMGGHHGAFDPVRMYYLAGERCAPSPPNARPLRRQSRADRPRHRKEASRVTIIPRLRPLDLRRTEHAITKSEEGARRQWERVFCEHHRWWRTIFTNTTRRHTQKQRRRGSLSWANINSDKPAGDPAARGKGTVTPSAANLCSWPIDRV